MSKKEATTSELGFWKPLATIVVLLYSIIFWFNFYIAGMSFGMEDTIAKGVQWIITAAVIVIGAIVIDFADVWIGKYFKGEELWEALGKIIAILVSIIFWFTWLGTMDFGVFDAIQKAVTWIIVVIILTVFPNILGFLAQTFEKYVPKPE